MGLITPDYGLVFWMLVSFGILIFILKKYAWKPILTGIKNREEQITKSLHEADLAREQIGKLHLQIEELSQKAKAERDAMMQEALTLKEKMIEEASLKAKEEAQKLLAEARETIKRDKESAQNELRSYTSKIAIQIAESILRHELDNKAMHERQIQDLLNEISSKN